MMSRHRQWDAATIFRDMTIHYDAGDRANASLYLCDPNGGPRSDGIAEVIAALRATSIWSAEVPKQVRDDQRQAYEQQLTFIEAAEFDIADRMIVIVRCDHPKFPSSAARFAEWVRALEALRSK